MQDYEWQKLHPFQRRSYKRLPAITRLVPEIASFEPLEGNGIQHGKIEFVNGSTLELGVDEVWDDLPGWIVTGC